MHIHLHYTRQRYVDIQEAIKKCIDIVPMDEYALEIMVRTCPAYCLVRLGAAFPLSRKDFTQFHTRLSYDPFKPYLTLVGLR